MKLSINLEKIDAPDIGEQPAGENLLVNSDFSSGNEGWENAVTSPGAADMFTVEFTMNEETETNASMVISMGAISGIDTPASTVELSEFSLIRTE